MKKPPFSSLTFRGMDRSCEFTILRDENKVGEIFIVIHHTLEEVEKVVVTHYDDCLNDLFGTLDKNLFVQAFKTLNDALKYCESQDGEI